MKASIHIGKQRIAVISLFLNRWLPPALSHHALSVQNSYGGVILCGTRTRPQRILMQKELTGGTFFFFLWKSVSAIATLLSYTGYFVGGKVPLFFPPLSRLPCSFPDFSFHLLFMEVLILLSLINVFEQIHILKNMQPCVVYFSFSQMMLCHRPHSISCFYFFFTQDLYMVWHMYLVCCIYC